MPKYTLYIDVWLIRLGCNFIFEYLLLWATANITNTRTSSKRLLLASLVGTIHYCFYLLASLNIIPFYGLLRFLPTVVIVSLIMLFIAFQPRLWSGLLKVATHFYIIGFVAAGSGTATAYIMGGQGTPQFALGTLVSMLTILIIAELGWGIVHKRVIAKVYHVPIELQCEGQSVELSGLVDTGNNLQDPLNQQPVIIVEKQALGNLLPAQLCEIIVQVDQGNLEALDDFNNLGNWQTRIRLIPFSSVGKTNGLLVGFRPDEIKIAKQELLNNIRPTIAVHPGNLDPKGEFVALVPPLVVASSLGIDSVVQEERGGSHANITPSDF